MQKPKLLQIDLTDECPLFCSHCSNSSGPACHGSLPLGAVIRTIYDAKALNVTALVLSGGEPLRYEDINPVLQAAASCGLHTTIFTTGISDLRSRESISRSGWETLKVSGLKVAAFSVYSGPKSRQLHNQIVRLRPTKRDAFAINEDGIKNAALAGIETHVHYIPSTESVGSLQEIYDWANSLNCKTLHVQFPTRQGRNIETRAVAVDSRDELTLQENVKNLRIAHTAVHVSWLWQYQWGLAGAGRREQVNQLIIRSDGEVVACNACKYLADVPHHNILRSQRSLMQIWESVSEASINHNCLEDCHNRDEGDFAERRAGLHLVRANV